MLPKGMQTYHVVSINNIIVPRGWKGYVAGVFQYIETVYILSIAIYFCKCHQHF